MVLNHSLLFSLINAGMPPKGKARGVLLPDDFVVLDEGHRIPSIATEHFGLHIGSYAEDRALKRLFNPRTNRGALAKHALQDLAAVERAIHAAQEFFAVLREVFLEARCSACTSRFCENTVSGPTKEVAERLGAIVKADDERAQDELRDRRASSATRTASAASCASPRRTMRWIEKTASRGVS